MSVSSQTPFFVVAEVGKVVSLVPAPPEVTLIEGFVDPEPDGSLLPIACPISCIGFDPIAKACLAVLRPQSFRTAFSLAARAGTRFIKEAHDCSWHETDLPRCPQFGRYRGESGHGGYERRLPSLTQNGHRRCFSMEQRPVLFWIEFFVNLSNITLVRSKGAS